MSKPVKIHTAKIPAFTGGINRNDPIPFIPEGDAYVINGYRCYPSKLQAFGSTTVVGSFGFSAFDALYNWEVSATGAEVIIAYQHWGAQRILAIASDFTYTDITGAVGPLPVYGGSYATRFGQYLFICNGNGTRVIRIDGALVASYALYTGPVPTDATLSQSWVNNGRIYFIEKDSTSYWYSDQDQVTGPLTEKDVGKILQLKGNLLFGTTWSSNTGATNELQTVLVSKAGEVLRYAGTYPDSGTWTLIGRSRIPEPIAKNSFCQIGGDVAVYTKNGVVLLSSVFERASEPATETTITDKIADQFRNFTFHTTQAALYGFDNSALLVLDKKEPFLYVKASEEFTGTVVTTETGYDQGFSGGIWCLNLKTGAWGYSSSLPNATAYCFCYAFETLVVSSSDGDLYSYGTPSIGSVSIIGPKGQAYRTIRSGWFDLGTTLIKHIKAVRLISGLMDNRTTGAKTTKCKMVINVDYFNRVASPTAPLTNELRAYQERTITSATGIVQPVITEFDNVGIMGKVIQIEMMLGYDDTNNQLDEIYGFEIDYEVGGLL